MFKHALLTAVVALLVSVTLGNLVMPWWPLYPSLFLLVHSFGAVLLIGIAVVLTRGGNSQSLSSALLSAIVIRLLACLVFVAVLRFGFPLFYKTAALQFFLSFIVYTLADLQLAFKQINKR